MYVGNDTKPSAADLVFITKGPCCATGSPMGLPWSKSNSTPEAVCALTSTGKLASSLAKLPLSTYTVFSYKVYKGKLKRCDFERKLPCGRRC